MKQVNQFQGLVAIGKNGSIADFIAAAAKHSNDPKAIKRLKEGIAAADESFAKWQKTEALTMIHARETPVAADMTVSARLAFEIAKAKNKFIPPNAQTFEGVHIELTPEVVATLEAAIKPLPSTVPLPVRKVFHDLFKEPMRQWLQNNRQSIAAFRRENGETTILIDTLPQNGAAIAPRLTSPSFEEKQRKHRTRMELKEFLAEGIHTRQPIVAPEKASFRKQSKKMGAG